VFEIAPDWATRRTEDKAADNNTLEAVGGPEVARQHMYRFDSKDINIITCNKLENEMYRGREI
jgi:hypothetical protein